MRIVEFVHVFLEAGGIESRFHVKEAESSAQCIVNHGKTAVCRVHHADDEDILRHKELLILVREGQSLATVIFLNQHKKFSEYLGEITPVDLIDDEEIVLIRVVRSIDAKLVKLTSLQFKCVSGRFVPHNEVLIRIVLVELNKAYA